LSRPLNNLGEVLWKRGFYDDAYLLHVKAYQLNSFPVTTMAAAPLSNIGGYFFLHKKYDEALKFYEESIKIKPSHPPTWMNLAKTQIMMKNFDGAEDTIRKAITKWPENEELHALLKFVRLKRETNDN
jgi:tetratricopeptide (TPR) repeat protein